MRTLAHLSDPHFGRIERATVRALIATVTEARPDIVVVSGDLTQRAKEREFQEARQFLDALPSPQIVVPGNHDVPLYNILARALKPLRNYQRYISNELEPFYCDDEIAIIGVNTARSLTLKNGRISHQQVVRSCARLEACGENRTRIIVSIIPSICPKPMRFTVWSDARTWLWLLRALPYRSNSLRPFAYQQHQRKRGALQNSRPLRTRHPRRNRDLNARSRRTEFI